MALSDKDYLKQAAALNQSLVDLSKQYILANPDGALEDWAEECIEDSAGDAALLSFWLANWTPEAGGEEASVAPPQRKAGVVYAK
jgi:hypothetical protein